MIRSENRTVKTYAHSIAFAKKQFVHIYDLIAQSKFIIQVGWHMAESVEVVTF